MSAGANEDVRVKVIALEGRRLSFVGAGQGRSSFAVKFFSEVIFSFLPDVLILETTSSLSCETLWVNEVLTKCWQVALNS